MMNFHSCTEQSHVQWYTNWYLYRPNIEFLISLLSNLMWMMIFKRLLLLLDFTLMNTFQVSGKAKPNALNSKNKIIDL